MPGRWSGYRRGSKTRLRLSPSLQKHSWVLSTERSPCDSGPGKCKGCEREDPVECSEQPCQMEPLELIFMGRQAEPPRLVAHVLWVGELTGRQRAFFSSLLFITFSR